MPLNYNLQIDLFDVWGIDFMGLFKNSCGYEYVRNQMPVSLRGGGGELGNLKP
jgi:hypothetical protein